MMLSDSFDIEVTHVEGAGAADVDAVDAHEGVSNGLTTVS